MLFFLMLVFLTACAKDNVEDVSSAQSVTEESSTVETQIDTSSFANEDLEADYIVIGAGPAGLSSAIEAAEAGLNVIVFEKTGATGGAAKFGMGPLALESHIQKEAGETLTVDDAFNEFMEYTHYRVDGNLVHEYFSLSGDTIAWLENMGVKFTGPAKYFDKAHATWHVVVSDDGTKGGGQAATMTRKMTEYAESLGVKVYLDTPVVSITKEDGIITGVVAVNEKEETKYTAKGKAVLVATGGFGNNVAMIEEELGYVWGEDYFGMKFPGHEGDGLKMAWNVGAARHEPNIEMIFNIYANDGPAITPEIMVLMRQPALLVNKEGKRFFNEEQIQNTTYTGNALANQTGNTGYMILSKSMLEDYIANGVDFESKVYQVKDYGLIFEQIETMMKEGSVSVFKGETFADVAEYIGCSEEDLKETFETYNQICKDGKDPMGKSKEYLVPFDGSELYVAQYFPGSYGTLGGIEVNSNLEVLDENDTVIPGLYSAGTDSCHIFGDSYMFLLPGNTMGYSLNSGRISARSAISYIKSQK